MLWINYNTNFFHWFHKLISFLNSFFIRLVVQAYLVLLRLKASAHQTQESCAVWMHTRARCNTRNSLNCVIPSLTRTCAQSEIWCHTVLRVSCIRYNLHGSALKQRRAFGVLKPSLFDLYILLPYLFHINCHI
jgi:hypothetical protein